MKARKKKVVPNHTSKSLNSNCLRPILSRSTTSISFSSILPFFLVVFHFEDGIGDRFLNFNQTHPSSSSKKEGRLKNSAIVVNSMHSFLALNLSILALSPTFLEK